MFFYSRKISIFKILTDLLAIRARSLVISKLQLMLQNLFFKLKEFTAMYEESFFLNAVQWILIFLTGWPILLSLGVIFGPPPLTEKYLEEDIEKIKKTYNRKFFFMIFYIFLVGRRSRWLVPCFSLPLLLLLSIFK